MEWAPGGDTYTLINEASPRLSDFKKAGEDAVRFILACLILGMEYLHAKNIMYRDLKPENVLIFENGYVKLTDFGLAKEIHEDELSKTEAGTTIYYAPEMVLKEGYQKEIDIWAIGVYAYEMSNYYPPFATSDIKEKLKVKRVVKMAEQKRIWKNPHLSDEMKDFINCILKF
jgi:serine/threonine protein kinase